MDIFCSLSPHRNYVIEKNYYRFCQRQGNLLAVSYCLQKGSRVSVYLAKAVCFIVYVCYFCQMRCFACSIYYTSDVNRRIKNLFRCEVKCERTYLIYFLVCFVFWTRVGGGRLLCLCCLIRP